MALTDILRTTLIAGVLLTPSLSPAQDSTQDNSQTSDQQSSENRNEKPRIPEITENSDQTIRSYKIGKNFNYSKKHNQIKWNYSKETGWTIVDDETGVMKVNRAIIRKTNGTIDRFVEFSNTQGNAHTVYYPVYQCKDCGEHHPEKDRTTSKGLYKSKAGVIFALGNQ